MGKAGEGFSQGATDSHNSSIQCYDRFRSRLRVQVLATRIAL
jgi:hypothetical protein